MAGVRKYDRDALVPVICERISAGEPLAAVCRQPGMPEITTVWDWMRTDPVIDQRITHAREACYDNIANRVRRTARGYGTELGGDSTGDVKRDRLIVDTDLKLLAKWDPRRYGEGFQLRMADADGNKLDTSPKFLEALALLKLAGAPTCEAQEVQVIDVTPRPAPADISDLV